VLPKTPWFKVYVHKFLRSDEDRALHDHPWEFWSVMLRGTYIEVTEDARTVRSVRKHPVVHRPATWRHRVELVGHGVAEQPCWTLIVTGPKVREWGFHCPDRFVHWREWGSAGCEG